MATYDNNPMTDEEQAKVEVARLSQLNVQYLGQLTEMVERAERAERERDEARSTVTTIEAALDRAERERDAVAVNWKAAHKIQADEARKFAQKYDEAIALADARGRALETLGCFAHDPDECPAIGLEEGDEDADEPCTCGAWEWNRAISQAKTLTAPEALRQQQEREVGYLAHLATLRLALENERDFLNDCASDSEADKLYGFSDAAKAITEALESTPLASLKKQQEREVEKDALIERLRAERETYRDAHAKAGSLALTLRRALEEIAHSAEHIPNAEQAAKTVIRVAKQAMQTTPPQALAQQREHETQATITQWAKDTFGEPADLLQIWKRINDEMNELYEALVTDQPPEKIAQECADVYIVLCQIPERLRIGLQSAVDDKMKVNRARKWRTNGDGTGQHIENGTV